MVNLGMRMRYCQVFLRGGDESAMGERSLTERRDWNIWLPLVESRTASPLIWRVAREPRTCRARAGLSV
jgi:hypothetical protein